jgi:ADP-ribose pyrophosphatase YjhB (NUDIX family)
VGACDVCGLVQFRLSEVGQLLPDSEGAFVEVREEAGIEIKNIRFLRVYNLKEFKPKHYLDISFVSDWASGEPMVMEPEKCESWGWYDLDNLPSPLFAGIKETIESYKTGKTFFDA